MDGTGAEDIQLRDHRASPILSACRSHGAGEIIQGNQRAERTATFKDSGDREELQKELRGNGQRGEKAKG